MFIKEVRIHGFKSYREKTVCGPLNPMHNSVVGLNGSGKSNFFAGSALRPPPSVSSPAGGAAAAPCPAPPCCLLRPRTRAAFLCDSGSGGRGGRGGGVPPASPQRPPLPRAFRAALL